MILVLFHQQKRVQASFILSLQIYSVVHLFGCYRLSVVRFSVFGSVVPEQNGLLYSLMRLFK